MYKIIIFISLQISLFAGAAVETTSVEESTQKIIQYYEKSEKSFKEAEEIRIKIQNSPRNIGNAYRSQYDFKNRLGKSYKQKYMEYMYTLPKSKLQKIIPLLAKYDKTIIDKIIEEEKRILQRRSEQKRLKEQNEVKTRIEEQKLCLHIMKRVKERIVKHPKSIEKSLRVMENTYHRLKYEKAFCKKALSQENIFLDETTQKMYLDKKSR